MKKFLLSMTSALALFATTADSAAAAGPAKVVVQLTTGDLKTFESRILKGLTRTAEHYAKQGREFEAVVVVHGDAYPFFLKALDGTPYAGKKDIRAAQVRLKTAIQRLQKDHGVRFEVCSVGMEKHGLEAGQFYAGVTPVASAFIALVDWQNRGYAYLPVTDG